VTASKRLKLIFALSSLFSLTNKLGRNTVA